MTMTGLSTRSALDADADAQVAAVNAAAVRNWRLQDFRTRLFRVLIGLAVGGFLLSGLYPFAQLAWKGSDSLPGYVYILNKTERPVKGELAGFWAPPNSYYPKEMWFSKYIVGQGGDVITHKGREIFINGKSIGIAQERGRNGRPLQMIRDGVIPAGHYFMWTPHPRSYDSRYSDIGLISDEKIRGRAYRLL